MLVFYPFAFSPVCTDQLNLYEEVLGEFKARGATLYGVSCDAHYSQTAFREQLGVTHRAALGLRAQGRGLPRVRRLPPGRLPAAGAGDHRPGSTVKWSYQADSPGDLPGANLIFDGLEAV